jgi:Short C-terminal domain
VFGKGKREKAQNLMASGAKGIGTVTNVQDTGVTMNDNPRVKMTFRIEPLDGSPAFDAHKTTTVSRVEIPRSGDRYPCWYDRADPSTWAYATVHDEEARAQIRAMFGPPAESLTGFGGAAPAMGGVAVAAPAPAVDPLERLQKLDQLHKTGVLTDAEFASKKAEILSDI